MAYVYILFSNQLNKFYIGSTRGNVAERLRRHLSNHKGFSAKAADWQVVFQEEFETYSEALKREKQLKNWKSREMIEKLISG
jgi:putative endonuclease